MNRADQLSYLKSYQAEDFSKEKKERPTSRQVYQVTGLNLSLKAPRSDTAHQARKVAFSTSLSNLPNELLFKIFEFCHFNCFQALATVSSPFNALAKEAQVHRICGRSPRSQYRKYFQQSQRACRRFESLLSTSKQLPSDVIDLFKRVKSYRKFDEIQKLEHFLDLRDNLLFWKFLGATNFDVEEAKSFQEIKQAYSSLNPSDDQYLHGEFAIDHLQGEFILDYLGLTSIPSDLLVHFEIRKLSLRSNFIAEFPEKLGKLLSATHLDLSSNFITSLPDSIGSLILLESLNLYGNKISSLPESLGKLTRLKALFLANNALTSVPETIGHLFHLKKLSLNRNQIRALPSSFGNLINLWLLGLSENLLTELPEAFTNLRSLKILWLDHNRLEALPKNFGDLENLEALWAQHNKLSFLPKSFVKLKKLKKLWLAFNRLSVLLKSFYKLSNLEQLGLSNNSITSLPKKFGNLPKLAELGLSNNPFKSLPTTFKRLYKLRFLKLDSKFVNLSLWSHFSATKIVFS